MQNNELETKDPEILLVEKEDEEEALVEYDIATYPSDYTLQGLYDKWKLKEKEIIIPEFQRSFVWKIEQSSKLIESFLLGLPVPPVFFYIDEKNKNQVIDGQQRLLSVFFYFDGLFGIENERGKKTIFRLRGLNEKSPFNDKKFDDLDSEQQRKLRDGVLRAINIRQLSPKGDYSSIFHIFERLNTGGTALTPQEIRNAVYRGEFLNKLKLLNKDTNWRLIIGKKTLDKHQKDIELILRAFALCYHIDQYEKPMYNYLNKFAEEYKNTMSGNVEVFIKNFPKATKKIYEQLPLKPFHVRGPLNTSAFDSIFCTIINNIETIPTDINERYEILKQDQKFIELTSMGTTDTKIVKERYLYVKEKLID